MIYDLGQMTGQWTRQFQSEEQWSNAFGRWSKLSSARKYSENNGIKLKVKIN